MPSRRPDSVMLVRLVQQNTLDLALFTYAVLRSKRLSAQYMSAPKVDGT